MRTKPASGAACASRSPPVSRREFVLTGLAAAAYSALAEGYGETRGSAVHFVDAQRRSALPASAQSQELTTLTLHQASELVRRKDVSPVELTEACLARIERHDRAINAFITVTREQALATAREMEGEFMRARPRGPLHGIPIALKDNIDTAGVLTTAASGVFKDRVPTADAEVVLRLKRAGAILLGKLNLHEFALGGTSAVTYFGPVRNPWVLDRVAGGSSGGSAAAVAADMCFGMLGTDTGGSIRIPASLCGIVGFKPTYGRVSNRGVIPMAWTLDHVGPMCKTVEDAALMLAAIAGFDPLDPTSIDAPVPDYSRAIRMETRKLRVGRLRGRRSSKASTPRSRRPSKLRSMSCAH
jgi:aspartyl-tRNA(Asn)/glutamyl-tRNA(Gln) amidotransferase subunit A